MKLNLQEEMPIEKLLLDPNNYRFLDLQQWQLRQVQRFHEPLVQQATLRLLERTQRYNLSELRASILSNGYVPLERIVVVPYISPPYPNGSYLIVEGNRRVAALKTLLRDHQEGVLTLDESQLQNFTKLPVAILEPGEEGLLAAERVLKGIRHITGPQEWGAYQQAYLILELVDQGQQLDDISRHLGLSRIETGRRYRAIRALRYMENDELYAGAAQPEFYRLFHELGACVNRCVNRFRRRAPVPLSVWPRL
jgi:ParB-like chromosome segregation protein Spo0J